MSFRSLSLSTMYTLFSDMGLMSEQNNIKHTLIPINEIDVLTHESRNDEQLSITFSEISSYCCVGIADIVNSTRMTTKLPNEKISQYYSVFLNTMASIAKRYGAIIVKNIGDSLLYYFPDTSDSTKKFGFMKSLECCLAMIDIHHSINERLQALKLPSMDYRISCDYGKISFARSFGSTNDDIFGTPVNVCSKINSIAVPNSTIVGGDMYRVVRGIPDYRFKEIKPYSLGFTLDYPVYLVRRKNS